MKPTAWEKAAMFGWSIAWNLLNLAVIWWVLRRCDQRPESVIVPVLGLLYGAVGSGEVATYYMARKAEMDLKEIAKALDDIRARLNPSEDVAPIRIGGDDQSAEDRGVLTRVRVNSVFSYIISLLCLWKLYIALSAYQ